MASGPHLRPILLQFVLFVKFVACLSSPFPICVAVLSASASLYPARLRPKSLFSVYIAALSAESKPLPECRNVVTIVAYPSNRLKWRQG